MDFIPTTFSLLIIFGALVYYLIKKRQNYWLHYNIPNVPESLFFLGRSQHPGIYIQSIYKRFRNCGHPFVGCFASFTPSALLLDLDLIKRVFIADFESFPDRGSYHNTKDDPLSSNLSRSEGKTWRRLRLKMTPTFSSGKMKFMFPTKVAIANRLVETVNDMVKSGNTELEVRDLCARYTTDVIGSVAFGIECNSLKNPTNDFRVYGERVTKSIGPLVEVFAAMYPKLCRSLHLKIFPQEIIQFYTNIARETLSMREKQKIKRNDFVQILIEMSKTPSDDGEPMLTLNEMIGQMFVFFIGGYETTSSMMVFCLYELSKNQHVQRKAREDIENTLDRFNGELTYECVMEMHYIWQLVDETLRMHPNAPTLRRVVRKPYLVPNTSIYLEVGIHALIPVYAIHHDPEYYPEPEEFNPDRFSPGEVQKRHPMAYIPFGGGPRVCIAERFAKIVVLLGIVHMLKHFRFTASEQTPKNVEYSMSEKRMLKFEQMFLNVEKIL